MGLVGGTPYFLHRMITAGKYREGLAERFGDVPKRPGTRPAVWIHGVSVGEILTARTLVETIAKRWPEWEILVTSSSRRGREIARKSFPHAPLFHFPFDFGPAIDRSLDRLRPSVVLLMETEIWPNFLLRASGRGIPIALVNGRLNEGSFRGYRRFRGLFVRALRGLRSCCVQEEIHARRFAALGVPRHRIVVTGMMKYDTAPSARDPSEVEGVRRVLGLEVDRPVVVAGSTHEGEEAAVLAAFQQARRRVPGAALVLAPRDPRRVSEVERDVATAGLESVRWTHMRSRPEALGDRVALVDTIGELERIYSIATCVFLGGSLVDKGGHNMIEPAGLGLPVLFGPHTWNFAEPAAALLRGGGAVRVRDADELHGELTRILEDPAVARRMGESGRDLILRNRGATERTLDSLRPLFQGAIS